MGPKPNTPPGTVTQARTAVLKRSFKFWRFSLAAWQRSPRYRRLFITGTVLPFGIVLTLILIILLRSIGFASVPGSGKGQGPIPGIGLNSTIPPTVTMTPRPIPNYPTVPQSWGPGAAQYTIATQPTANQTIYIGGVQSAGGILLANRVTINSTDATRSLDEAGTYDPHSQSFTPLFKIQQIWTTPVCCQYDGRFYLASDADAPPGSTCGTCHALYWAYDDQTNTLLNLRQLLEASFGKVAVLNSALLDHGIVIMNGSLTNNPINQSWEINLSTQQVTALQIPGVTPSLLFYGIQSFAWPDVIYTLTDARYGNTVSYWMNVVTNQTGMLPAGFALWHLQGTTLYAVATDGATVTVREFDQYHDPTIPSQVIATFSVPPYDGLAAIVGVDSRIISFGTALVYDRAEHHLVALVADGHTDPAATYTSIYGQGWLGYYQLDGSTSPPTQRITLYQIATLPTH